MIDIKIERTNGEIVRVRKVSPVQTRRGAERIEREIREAVVAGTWGKPGTADAPTLAEWCEQFITDHSQAKGLRPSTISEQRGAFRNYLLPAIGPDTRVDTIAHAQLLAVRKFMAAKDLAPKTINNALGVMTKALGFYYESRGLPAPHWGSVRAKVPKSPPKFWEPEQYAEIIAAAERVSPEAVAAVLVMGDCGLRAGELIGLEWTHVRSKPTPQLVIQRSYTAGHFGPPKGGRPRSVPMTRRVAVALAGDGWLDGARLRPRYMVERAPWLRMVGELLGQVVADAGSVERAATVLAVPLDRLLAWVLGFVSRGSVEAACSRWPVASGDDLDGAAYLDLVEAVERGAVAGDNAIDPPGMRDRYVVAFDTWDRMEADLLGQLLDDAGSVRKAAPLLGVSRSTLAGWARRVRP